jgi:hypothetical protein
MRNRGEPTADRTDARATVGGATVGGAAGADRGPAIVVRPHRGLRAAGPVLVLAGVVAGLTWSPAVAALLVAAGLALLPLLVVRVECDGSAIRRRAVRGWEEPIPLDRLRGMRLRRVPFRAVHGWRRSYRLGSWSSVPVRLRLSTPGGVALQLTVAWWSGWPALAQFVQGLPGVTTDHRSLARLERALG